MDPVTLGMAKSATRKIQRQWVRPYSDRTRPWYLDAFWQFFRGNRLCTAAAGILDGSHYAGSSTLASASTAGLATMTVVDGSRFRANEYITVGSSLTSRGDLFLITSIAGNVLTVSPTNPTSRAAGSNVSSVWFNTYHLTIDGANDWANFVAYAQQYSAMPGVNLINYGGFSSTYTDVNGVTGVPVGMESLTVNTTCTNYAFWNTTEGQQRSRDGYSILMASTATGGGLRTKDSIKVQPGDNINASIIASGSFFRVQVVDKANPGTVISEATYSRTSGSGISSTSPGERQVCDCVVPAGVTDIEVRLTGLTGSASVTIDDLRIVRSRQNAFSQRYVFEDPRGGNIVLMGDSWAAGQCGVALADAFTRRFGSNVTLINKGVPGNRLDQMTARFATDCAPYDPVYVIWEWGANDVSAAYSTSQMVNNVQVANDLTRGIGAIPVHTGIPACADSSTISLAQAANELVRARIDGCTI